VALCAEVKEAAAYEHLVKGDVKEEKGMGGGV